MTALGRRAFLATLLSALTARALGRTPVGGGVRFAVPLRVAELDPHVLGEPLSALFAPAAFDPLYALDASGKPYPALARALPEPAPDGTRLRVTLRAGLVSARGKRLDARDVAFSLARARKHGGAAVLGEVGEVSLDPKDRLAVAIAAGDANALALSLSSPLTALVPRGFSALAPDGTGAFRADVARGELRLARNQNAARGAAFLERIDVRAASDLADALRAFESELCDVGWLGSGLHRPRPGAVAFEGPALGWVILRTGAEAGSWGAPGIAEKLLERVPAERLRPLGIVAPPRAASRGTAWGGGAAELLVSAESPQLAELADVLAPLLSQAAHPVRARRVPHAEFTTRRASGRYALLLDFVRRVGPPGRATLLALLAAANPELAARPPQVPSYEPVEIARRLPFGVVGDLRVAGARVAAIHGLDAWQLGSVYRSS